MELKLGSNRSQMEPGSRSISLCFQYMSPTHHGYLPSGDNIDLSSGDEIDLPSGDEIDLPSGDDIDLSSGDDIDLPSGDDIDLPSGECFKSHGCMSQKPRMHVSKATGVCLKSHV